MLFSIFFLSTVVLLIRAEDLSNGGRGTNLEAGTGYTLSTMIDNSGKPAGQAYAYLGGKLSQVQPQPSYYPDESTYLAPVSRSLWVNQLSSASYFAAGVLAAFSIWYICSVGMTAAKKTIHDLHDKATVTKETSDTEKSRRRRSLRKDDEMTRLASIVLTAVQSGECFQKTICLLGSQVSSKKGRLADSLLSTLLPVSIQQSDYFIILRKSLRGEVSCEKFGCNAH